MSRLSRHRIDETLLSLAELDVIIVDSLVESLDQKVAACKIQLVQTRLLAETHACVNRNYRSAFLSRLGGHDNDTVRGTGTVDGSGCRIFQDLHRLDIGRVQCCKTCHGLTLRECSGISRSTGNWHAINDIQRFVTGIEGTDTTDAHTAACSRDTRCGSDIHTGNTSLEKLVHRKHVTSFRCLRLELTDG